jgi:hypothetical protein
MSQGQASPKPKQDPKAEKEAYLQKLKEQEIREREQRLQGHRQYLHEQMMIRRDYYKLGLVHKLIIFILFTLLFTFVTFLVLSYFPPTKSTIFKALHQIL